MKRVLFLTGLLSLIIFSCKKDNESTDLTNCGTVTYEGKIKAILESECNSSSCHGSRVDPNLTNYEQLKTQVDNGNLRKEVIDQQSMPKLGSLSQEDYDAFNCWIHNGAPKE